MTGTATASRAYAYPTMAVYPGVVYTWYAIDTSRRIKKRWVWKGGSYPSNKTSDVSKLSGLFIYLPFWLL